MPDGTPTLYMRRVLPAPRERVFDAFVDPTQMSRWFCPHERTCILHELDVRPGGRYRIGLQGPDDTATVNGEYREVVPPERLVMTWVWESGENAGHVTLVTLRFNDAPEGTVLTLTHEFPGRPEEAVANHSRGWNSVFDNLEGYLAG